MTSSAQTTPVADARAERHADQIARRKLHPRRNAVGIGLIERDRHQDIDDLLWAKRLQAKVLRLKLVDSLEKGSCVSLSSIVCKNIGRTSWPTSCAWPRHSWRSAGSAVRWRRRIGCRPFRADKLTEAQKKAAAEFSEGRGYDLRGPWVPLLRSPDMLLRAKGMNDSGA